MAGTATQGGADLLRSERMWADVVAIYRASKKKKDINWFTEWVCRPPAAFFVYLVQGTRITPNQVTFLSLVVAAVACGAFLLIPGPLGAIAGAAIFELSFILDCADGQLARVRGESSPLGHLFDFLMDEIKALMLFGTIAIRLWLVSQDPVHLLAGLAGLFALASGIAITSFTRRPEYGAAPPTSEGQPAELRKRSGPVGMAIGTLEWASRIIVHYPQYIWLLAAIDRLDIYFWGYGAINVVYLGYATLGLLVRLCRPRSRPTIEQPR
jgi:phosphatidylglycerophosphate synthase